VFRVLGCTLYERYGATGDRFMKLSANLGFLFTDLPLAARIYAAHNAGFDAVEFHDQLQSTALAPVVRALSETGLEVISLNTRMGATMGQAALSQAAFRNDLEAALGAAAVVGAGAVHVTAGVGGTKEVYLACLSDALAQATCPILIEPICSRAIPDYHLCQLAQAEAILGILNHPRLKLLFDWYHVATMEGVAAALSHMVRLAPQIGHVQLARLADRGDPVPEHMPELGAVLRHMRKAGLGTIGLEYHPTQPVAATLVGLRKFYMTLQHDTP
jgi:hydroxypyruvate isomerase